MFLVYESFSRDSFGQLEILVGEQAEKLSNVVLVHRYLPGSCLLNCRLRALKGTRSKAELGNGNARERIRVLDNYMGSNFVQKFFERLFGADDPSEIAPGIIEELL